MEKGASPVTLDEAMAEQASEGAPAARPRAPGGAGRGSCSDRGRAPPGGGALGGGDGRARGARRRPHLPGAPSLAGSCRGLLGCPLSGHFAYHLSLPVCQARPGCLGIRWRPWPLERRLASRSPCQTGSANYPQSWGAWAAAWRCLDRSRRKEVPLGTASERTRGLDPKPPMSSSAAGPRGCKRG